MEKLGTVRSNIETATKSDEFFAVMKSFAAAKYTNVEAKEFANTRRYGPRVESALALHANVKSAVDALGTGTDQGGAALAPYTQLSNAYAETLAPISPFDFMFTSMRVMPLRSRFSVSTVGVVSANTFERQTKPISKLSIDALEQNYWKSTGIVVTTKELLLMSGMPVASLLNSELKRAISKTTNETFISTITAGLTPITSSGSTVAAARKDLNAAFQAIEGDAESRYFILMPANIAKALSFSLSESGSPAFPDLTPKGGSISGVPVLCTDALTAQIVVVDAWQIGADRGVIIFDSSQNAILQLDDAPDSPPSAGTPMSSLWQMGLVAISAERIFGAKRLRANAVALIDGAVYQGNSPE